MSLNFFDMLREEQEKEKKLAEELSKPKKEAAVPTVEEKPKGKDKQPTEVKAAKTSKKESKEKSSFEEQYKNIKDSQLKMLVDKLLELEGMRELMEHPDVSIDKMYNYCRSEAQKLAKNGFFFCMDDSVLIGWGRHYYDEHGKVAR